MPQQINLPEVLGGLEERESKFYFQLIDALVDVLDDKIFHGIVHLLPIAHHAVDSNAAIRALAEQCRLSDQLSTLTSNIYGWLSTMRGHGMLQMALKDLERFRKFVSINGVPMEAYFTSQDVKKKDALVRHQTFQPLFTSQREADAAVDAFLRRREMMIPGAAVPITHDFTTAHDHVQRLHDAVVDFDKCEDKGGWRAEQVRRLCSAEVQVLCWMVYRDAKKSHVGKVNVPIWSSTDSAYRYEEFDSFEERWDYIVEYFRASKLAVSNLLLAPNMARFVSAPSKEFTKKQRNKDTNDAKAAMINMAKQTMDENELTVKETTDGALKIVDKDDKVLECNPPRAKRLKRAAPDPQPASGDGDSPGSDESQQATKRRRKELTISRSATNSASPAPPPPPPNNNLQSMGVAQHSYGPQSTVNQQTYNYYPAGSEVHQHGTGPQTAAFHQPDADNWESFGAQEYSYMYARG
ncbi:hypothetical protein B0T17DRAFT_509093 [Bombardia bombarda]|uniref:Uncharacterized protein n=1 Tax=Bombardia bombarda TaxID=252184 RepID=A0AA39WUE4_9PEZI|nr:hypothetical protein B0T17DRAFT_509093 [Bombardia bombarda]